MKKLTIAIQMELTVPDTWELVSTSEDTEVIKMGEGQYLDFIAEPIIAQDPEDEWDTIDDESVYAGILGLVTGEAVEIALSTDEDDDDDDQE